jgi:hypothetical protein
VVTIIIQVTLTSAVAGPSAAGWRGPSSAGASLIGGVQQSLDLVDRDRPLDDLRVRHLVCDRLGDVVDLGAFDAGGLERMRHVEAGSQERCLGVKVKSNLPAGCSASQARVSLEVCAE